jgi:hypothetical protein
MYPTILIKVTQMAIVLIAPVATHRKNGYPADLTGIDLTDPHCLIGTVNTYGAVKIAVRWTISGLCRGTGESCNLAITSPEVADVVEAAKRLRADFTTSHSTSVRSRRIPSVAG